MCLWFVSDGPTTSFPVLTTPQANNVALLRDSCTSSLSSQKEVLQHAQAQISTVIEPTAAELIPIAEELEDVYKQIDLLEGLINRVGENLKDMEKRVVETEQAVRREEKYLDEGKPVELWQPKSKEASGAKRFKAQHWVQGNRLVDPTGGREQ